MINNQTKEMKTVIYLVQILAICLLTGCRGCQKNDVINNTNTVIAPPTEDAVSPKVNVYIENSGSMDGYMDGDTDFKNVISYLLVQLDLYYDNNVNIRFINSKIDSTTITRVDLGSFANVINVLWDESKRKGRGDTDLDNIFNNILSQTNENTITILFSDCIYSMKQGVDGTRYFQKNATIYTFNNKLKDTSLNLTTTIVKMSSKFKGRYFPYTGDNQNFRIDMERPYYICVIANQTLMNNFIKKPKLQFENLQGYKNKYVISPEDTRGIYYSVLQSTYNKGRFKPDRRRSTNDYIHGIESVNLHTSGGGCTRGKEYPLSFAVAVNFSNIQAENDYFTNPENYTITTDNFTIDSIIPIVKNQIKPNDWNRIAAANPTHIIILTAKTKAVSNISFVLKKQIPQWIENSSTENDTSGMLNESTTFGLKYLVEGITEAYETIYPNNKNFFECTISISK